MNNTAKLNPVMTGLAQEFYNDESGFIGEILFPNFSSGMPSGQYYKFDVENWVNIPDDIGRAPGKAYNSVSMSLSDDNFVTRDQGIQTPVDDTERALYSNQFSLDQAATERATQIVRVRHEIDVQNAVQAPGAMPTSTMTAPLATGTVQALKANFAAARRTIRLNCGLKPTVTCMSETSMDALKANVNIVEQIKHTVNAGVTTEDLIAKVLDIPPIKVASAIVNNANEGQTVSTADLWGTDIYMTVSNPSPDLQAVNFGRTFSWDEGNGGGNIVIDSWRDENARSDWFRSRAYRGQKITGAACGYRLLSI